MGSYRVLALLGQINQVYDIFKVLVDPTLFRGPTFVKSRTGVRRFCDLLVVTTSEKGNVAVAHQVQGAPCVSSKSPFSLQCAMNNTWPRIGQISKHHEERHLQLWICQICLDLRRAVPLPKRLDDRCDATALGFGTAWLSILQECQGRHEERTSRARNARRWIELWRSVLIDGGRRDADSHGNA